MALSTRVSARYSGTLPDGSTGSLMVFKRTAHWPDCRPRHHVARVDTNAGFHPPLRRQACVLGLEYILNIDRTIRCLDYSGSFGQYDANAGIYELALAFANHRVLLRI